MSKPLMFDITKLPRSSTVDFIAGGVMLALFAFGGHQMFDLIMGMVFLMFGMDGRQIENLTERVEELEYEKYGGK